MKHFKDLDACIAALRAMQARDDIGPEQKENVKAAIEEAKRLRRMHDAGPPAMFRCIRRICERLIDAFIKD